MILFFGVIILIMYSEYSNLTTINEYDLNYKIENIEGANLGLILILDHLENPVSFLKKFLNLV